MTIAQAYTRRKINVEHWQIDEIMKFASEVVERRRTHSIHYLVQSSFGTSEEDRLAYEQLVNDRREVWKVWQMLRDLTTGPEIEQ